MPAHCPPSADLAAFALGTLPPDAADSVAGHVNACPTCEATMVSFEQSTDTLVEQLRTPPVEDTGLAALLERAEKLVGPGDQPPAAVLKQLRDYQLLEQLGQGGMGAVYRAVHVHLDRTVAVKVLPPERTRDPQSIARFRREMRAVGKLQHPNIVAAHDAGEADGTHFLVMELVEGIDASRLVRAAGPLPIADAAEIIRQAAAGLQHASAHGLVHRDIKPSNLMVTKAGQVKLLDLGLALLEGPQPAGEELTQASQMMGTADYVAPEQTGDSHGVDIRADIYSLGCTLYKLLTGEAPFSGPKYTTPIQKMMAHVGTPAPDLRAKRPDAPAGLAAIIAKMLAKQPADRYATPAEVAAALVPFCSAADLAALVARASVRDLPLPLGEGRGEGARIEATSATHPTEATSTFVRSPAPADSKADSRVPVVCAANHSDSAKVRTKWIALAAASLLIALAAAVIIRLRTADGTLILTVEEPDNVTVEIDGEKAIVKLADGNSIEVSVDPGVHELVVKQGNIRLKVPDRFTMEAGGKTQLTAILDSKPTTKVGDPNRRAAEWVLSIGGAVEIEESGGAPRRVEGAADLPRGAFRLMIADLYLNQKAGDTGLACFQGCKDLEQLYLTGTQVTDTGLAHFQGCRGLTVLALSAAGISDAGMVHFKDCKKLTDLDLHRTRVGDSGLVHFKGCRDLKTLQLHGTRVTNAGLVHFQDCEKLTHLYLGETDVTDDGLAHFKGCQDLVHLYLSQSPITDAGLDRLLGFAKLASLDISKTAATEAGVKKLAAALPQCRIEWDGGAIEPKVVADPDRRAAEWVISVGGFVHVFSQGTTLDAMRRVEELPQAPFQLHIATFEAENVPVEDIRLENLKDLKNLREIALGSNATDETVSPLTAHKGLISLTVHGAPKFTNAGLQKIRGFDKLQELHLSGTAISDDGLDALQGTPNLTRLSIHHTSIGDPGLQHVARLKKLEFLHVGATHVTDQGLQHIKGLSALALLSVGDTGVSDQGLVHLEGLTRLRHLALANTKVSAAGVKKLAAALPQCRIEWDGGVIEPTVVTDPERAVAEWSLALGKRVGIVVNGKGRWVQKVDELPAEPFQINTLSIDHLPGIQSAEMTRLRGLSGLRSLVLANTDIADAAFDSILELETLDTLDLTRCRQITPAGLVRLAQHERLATLRLQSMPVNADVLKAFQTMPALRSLAIRDNALDAAAFDALKGLRQLTQLNVINCTLTDTQISALQQALPNCKIEWSPAEPRQAVARQPKFVSGEWSIEGDVLLQSSKATPALLIFGDAAWSDGDFTCEVWHTKEDVSPTLLVRAIDEKQHVYSEFGGYKNTLSDLQSVRPGGWQRLGLKRYTMPVEQWVPVKVELRGKSIRLFADGKEILKGEDETRLSGAIGLRTWGGPAKYRNLRFTDPAGNVLWEGLPELPNVTANP
jgi:serine/threonine protein kinase